MQPKQTAKQIAINTARRIAQETNETLKTGQEQIFSTPKVQQQEIPQEQKQQEKRKEEPKKSPSFMNDLRGELEQIRRENLFKELQRKIANGEYVALSTYEKELGYEQREVLKAQMQAVEERRASELNKKESVPQIVSKKARGMLGMVKKRNQQHVEMRQPPSG